MMRQLRISSLKSCGNAFAEGTKGGRSLKAPGESCKNNSKNGSYRERAAEAKNAPLSEAGESEKYPFFSLLLIMPPIGRVQVTLADPGN